MKNHIGYHKEIFIKNSIHKFENCIYKLHLIWCLLVFPGLHLWLKIIHIYIVKYTKYSRRHLGGNRLRSQTHSIRIISVLIRIPPCSFLLQGHHLVKKKWFSRTSTEFHRKGKEENSSLHHSLTIIATSCCSWCKP
jgi:hypothetical protein